MPLPEEMPDSIPVGDVSKYETSADSMPDSIPVGEIGKYTGTNLGTIHAGPENYAPPGTTYVPSEDSYGHRFASDLVAAGNSLLPFADEAAAGVRSVLPGFGSYSDELAAIRAGEQEHEQRHPYEAAASSLTAMLAAGAGIPSGLRAVTEFADAKNLGVITKAALQGATLAGEGAAYGGAYGFASGEGDAEERLKNAERGAELGATIGTGAAVIGGAVKAGQGVQRFFSPTARAEAAQQGAREVVEKVADVGTALPRIGQSNQLLANAPEDLAQFSRTAEITQDPGIAALEQAVRKTNPQAEQTIQAQDLEREAARQEIFNQVNPNPIAPEEAAPIVRAGLESNLGKSKAEVANLAKTAFQGGEELQTASAKVAVAKAINKFTATGARSLSGDFEDLVGRFQQLPDKTDLQTLQDYRSTFGKYASAGKKEGDTVGKMTAEIAGTLRKTIDESVDEAAARGELSQEQHDAWRKMISTRREQSATFRQGAVGSALKQNPFGDYALEGSKVPSKLLATPESRKQTIEALKSQSSSMEALRGSLLSKVWDASTRDVIDPATNLSAREFSPAQFNKQLRAINKMEPELITETQVKALNKIGENLTRQTSVSKIAYKASQGQSITSQAQTALDVIQNTVKEQATKQVEKAFSAAHPVLGTAFNLLTKIIPTPATRQELINKELAKFVLDPVYAEALLKRSNTSAAKAAIGQFAERLTATASALAGNKEQQPKKRSPQMPVINSAPRTTASQKAEPKQQAEISSTLDPLLSKAIEIVESSGNPNAISNKGAIGTHQVTPPAIRDVLRARGIDHTPYSDKQLQELAKLPGMSKHLGESYLSLLLGRYNGDVEKALLAYHTGVGNVASGNIGPVGSHYAQHVLNIYRQLRGAA